MIGLVLLLPGPVLAAGFTCATPETVPSAKDQIVELDEVIVRPGKSVRGTRDLNAWLKRLEGQYRYEGYVDLCGQGHAADRRPVTGEADCVSLYEDFVRRPYVSLYCVLDVRWPQVHSDNGVPGRGGEPDLSPAVVVYGVVPDLPGIQSMQIDGQGRTLHAQGRLVADTLTTRGSCGMSGACQATTRITSRPDSEEVAMVVDVEIESRRVLRHAFLLHRKSNMQLTRTPNGIRMRVELLSVGER